MAKVQCMAKVVRAEQLAEGVFSMHLLAPEIAAQAVPGQFVSLYCDDSDKLLPRPISLCEIERESGLIRLVYRIVGTGTREFSKKKADDRIRILGPLGNGFPIHEISNESHSILIGGGIGIPPMLELAKQLKGKTTVVLGYRNSDTFLLEEFKKAAYQVVIATEDGSLGIQGNVMDAIKVEDICGDVIYSCGPIPMLRGVKEYGLHTGVKTWLSMEEKMACGIGACLACVCSSTQTDDHSRVKNKRICKDGPVFLSTEIEL
jgi:dihydroorotate dehydrogenase electron transfer subunit